VPSDETGGTECRRTRTTARCCIAALRWMATLCGAGWPALAQSGARTDVPYLPGATAQQTLDLSVPSGSRGFATLVMVHGGGLTEGDKRDFELPAICANVVLAGFGCASVNYRLGPAVRWPSQPDDVAAAVAWVRHHVAEHGGDSTAIFLLGHSSGCVLASMLGTDATYLRSARLAPDALAGVIAMGCLLAPVLPAVTDSGRLRAFFTGSGALATYGSLEAFVDANPTAYVGPHVPPTLVLIAEAEQINPPILERARAFELRMNAARRPVEVVVLPDRRHMTALTAMASPDDPTLQLLISFMRKVVGARR
jgi:acetyl esterase/lipase